MATEQILMRGVEAGGDRQELHESIRVHSQAAGREVKQFGRPNDLMERLGTDAAFAKVDLSGTLDPQQFIGRAPEQVDDFIAEVVNPIRERYRDVLHQQTEELRV